jgi:hypothetical protein
MLQARMAAAVESGTYALPRKHGSIHEMVQANCIATVAVRVPFASPFDPVALSRAEAEGRRQAFVYETFLRREVAGFADAKIIGLSSPQIGIRESRRLLGAYRLTREDCLSQARFDDHRQNAVGEEETDWAYIPDGGVYDVPYRTFIAPGFDRLWVAGRCFSATHSAQASCRSMAQTMSMGQAVGVAAALSLANDVTAAEVPVAALQSRLAAFGAVLASPAETAATGRNEWFLNRGEVKK